MDSSKIEHLVLSIATNQFTVPIPTGKEIVRAVNSHAALYEALEKIIPTGEPFNTSRGQFYMMQVPLAWVEKARAALALGR